MKKDFPKIALGTWLMGGTGDPDPNNDDEADIQKILLAIKSGVKLIDTAQKYANGKCEELVGQALKRLDQGDRSNTKILTKHDASKLNSIKEIRSDIEGSFKRLEVDVIDYYLLHDSGESSNYYKLKDYFSLVSEFVDLGRIKNLGVSNFSIELTQYAKTLTKHPITVNQSSLNIFNRRAVDVGLLDYCLKNEIAFQAYRPLADLADKIRNNKIISSLARAKGIDNFQLSLAYLFKKGAAITISASSEDHWRKIKAVASKNLLTDEDIDFIEANIASEANPYSEMDSFIEAKLN
jgi:diketogulonate reductase-like aldo/keto reductase